MQPMDDGAGSDDFGELLTSSQDEDDEDGSSDDDARLFLYAHEVEPNTMQDVVDEMGLQGNVHLTGRLQVRHEGGPTCYTWGVTSSSNW